MTKKIFRGLSLLLLAFVIFSAALTGTYELIIPSTIPCGADGEIPAYPLVSSSESYAEAVSVGVGTLSAKVDYRLYGIIP